MVKKIIFICVVSLLLVGCSYSVYSNAYPHLKRIQLMALDNSSSEFVLGETVYNRLAEAIRDDGRLRLVTQQPDCQLEGQITSFSEKIYSYDEANNVQEYIVSIAFSMTFTDLIKNEILYPKESKNITLTEVYSVNGEGSSRLSSKSEAVDEICDKLFKIIMQNTLETW